MNRILLTGFILTLTNTNLLINGAVTNTKTSVVKLTKVETKPFVFACPEEDGRYADPEYCDKYYICKDGNTTNVVCPNGLVFDDTLCPKSMEYPCIHLKNIECGTRALPIPKNSTPECSYDFETKGVGFPSECNRYRICSNGVAIELSCPENLAYSPREEICEWADLVEECNASAFAGFECPEDCEDGSYFESQENCSHYFICYNKRPRWMICSEGKVFDPCRSDCVKPEELKCGLCKKKKIEASTV